MLFTSSNGQPVSYRKDGSGPALVLVHGTGGDSEANWAGVAADLAQDHTVIRPDYSGSGQTRDDGGPLSARGLAAQVRAVAEAAGAKRFTLVGFSLGAAVAARLAADHPDRVRALMLLAGFAAPDPRLTMQFRLWRDLIATDRATLARLILLTGFSPDALSGWGTGAIEDAVQQMVATQNWDGMARQIALDLTLDVSDALPLIRVPTRVIGNTHDHMVPPSHARALAQAIPGASHAELPTGHLAPMERPDLLAAEIRAFAKRH